MHNGAEDLSNCSEEENDSNKQWCEDDQFKDGQNHFNIFLTSKHHANNWSHSTVEQYAIIPAPFKANIKSL